VTPLRAITFDVGGTLIEPWPSVGHVYSAVATEFGLHGVAPADLNRQFIAAWKARATFDYSRRAWQELVDQSFLGLCSEPPGPHFFDALYCRFGRGAAWRVFDDVRPALEQLKALGLKLGVISNWDERLRPLLAELRLLECFDTVVISSEAGHLKPTTEIFVRAASSLSLPPSAILHVGDSAREDVAGARAAGLRAALLARQPDAGPTGAIPDLLTLLSSLERFSHGGT
jgi:putative hydrolase of the HAD superfamily